MRRVQEPKVTKTSGVLGGEEYSHPAYGQISVSRVQGGKSYLYGSDFAHHNTVRIEIRESVITRSGSTERPHASSQLIEIELSESQWASMVSSLNVGSGTMCTLLRVAGKEIPNIAQPPDKRESFAKEISSTLGKSLSFMRDLEEMLNSSGMPQKKITAMLGVLRQAKMNTQENVDYVSKVFGEHMEDTVSKAKTEVEAYVAGTIARAGLKALQDSGGFLRIAGSNE